MMALRRYLQRPVTALVLLLLAIGIWGVTLRTHTSRVKKHSDTGLALARQGRVREAENEWRAAIHDDPNDVQSYVYLAEYYTAIKNWPSALDAAKQIARLHPETSHIDALLAKCSLNSGDERSAYGYAEAAIKRDGDDVETLLLFSHLLAKTGEDKRRLEILRHLRQLRPSDSELALSLAEALVAKKLYVDATTQIEPILKQEPDNVEAHSLRGIVLYNLDPSAKGSESASKDFLIAITSPRFAPVAHFYLGKIYNRLGKPAQAVPHLEAAAQAFPSKREVFFALATACDQVGNPKRAASARQQFIELRTMESRIDTLTSQCAAEPTNFEKRFELATLLAKHGDYERAEVQFNRVLEQHPKDSRVLAALQRIPQTASKSEL